MNLDDNVDAGELIDLDLATVGVDALDVAEFLYAVCVLAGLVGLVAARDVLELLDAHLG